MGSKVKLTLLCLLAVGVLDHLYATQSSADSTVRRLGLHQDKSETPETLRAGAPVVSISIGLAANFAYAERRPTAPGGGGGGSGYGGAYGGGAAAEALPEQFQVLRSGDVILFGGPSRMLFHGVPNVCGAHTFPRELQMANGRLNLTFRKI